MKQIRLTRNYQHNRIKIGLVWIVAIFFIVMCSHGQEPTLVIENARVIVGDGTVKDVATVVIAADRILSVSTDDSQFKAVKRIDARGRTLMPGLIDTHIHFGLTGQSRVAFRKQIEKSPPKYLKDFIQHGVTTVKSLADPLDLVREPLERYCCDAPG